MTVSLATIGRTVISLLLALLLANTFLDIVLGVSSVRNYAIYALFCAFVFVFLHKHALQNLNHLPGLDLAFIASFLAMAFYAFIGMLVLNRITFEYVELFLLGFFFLTGYLLDKRAVNQVTTYLVIAGLILSLAILVDRSWVYAQGVNYLRISFLPTVAGMVLLYRASNKQGLWKKLALVVLFLICLVAAMQIQSRANGLLLLMFSVALLIWQALKKGMLKGLLLLSILVATIFSYAGTYLENSSLPFFIRLSTFADRAADEPRMRLLELFFENLSNFMFTGYGIGMSSEQIYSSVREAYPHNYLLHLWSDFGVMGLVLATILSAIIASAFIKWRSFENKECLIFLLFYFINFSKSFSIYDAWPLFLYAGIARGHLRSVKAAKNTS